MDERAADRVRGRCGAGSQHPSIPACNRQPLAKINQGFDMMTGGERIRTAVAFVAF